MPKPIFSAYQFTATQWDSAEVKAKFANHFMRFIHSEFKETLFTHAFYNRLSMSFGHIAHYAAPEFYRTWFETTAQRLDFLKHTLRLPCYGAPGFTYSDVERALQIEVKKTGLVDHYTLLAESETRARELAQLERLQRKYAVPVEPSVPATAAYSTPECSTAAAYARVTVALLAPHSASPIQATLF